MRKSIRMMRKSLWLTGAALLAVAATASIALAAVNVKSEPTAEFGVPNAASVTLTGGEFSGLGSVEAEAELTATGEATYTCENAGGNAAPGQNPVKAEEGSSGKVGLGNSEHNGRGTISTLTASVKAPPTPSAKQVGCGGTGSTKWKVKLDTLTATGAHLVITQKNKIVFCRNYTLDGPATGTAC
jgi:hypothetical protein